MRIPLIENMHLPQLPQLPSLPNIDTLQNVNDTLKPISNFFNYISHPADILTTVLHFIDSTLGGICLCTAMICVILYACGNKEVKKYIYIIPSGYMLIKYILFC